MQDHKLSHFGAQSWSLCAISQTISQIWWSNVCWPTVITSTANQCRSSHDFPDTNLLNALNTRRLMVSKAMQIWQVCQGKFALADKTGLFCDKLKQKIVNTILPLSVSSHLRPHLCSTLCQICQKGFTEQSRQS